MKQRIAYIDILKTLSIFGVILIHISSRALINYNVATVNWDLSVFWGAVVRWSVPVFLMCSGALFLNQEKSFSTKQIFTKYLPRIIAALIFWAVLYEACDVFLDYRETGVIQYSFLKTALKNLLTCNTHFHLYYLYIIILIYALAPIIRVFTDAADRRQLEYALAAWFILGILYPFVIQFYPFNMLKGMVLQYSLRMAYSSIGYFVLGHYFQKYSISKRFAGLVYLLGILGFAVTFMGTIYKSGHTGALETIFLEGMTPNVALMAAAVFLWTKNLQDKAIFKSQSFLKTAGFISRGSFCVYLIHDFINIAYRNLYIESTIFNPLLSIPFLSLVNLGISLGIYVILSKVPVVKKYLI